MAKTNFTKMEEALTGGLNKMKVDALLKLTEHSPEKLAKLAQLLSLIESDLKWMRKSDPEIYKKLGIKKSELKGLEAKMREKKPKITEQETSRIKEMLSAVEKYKKEKFPARPDEEQVEAERIKHINKRFNVNEKWLPLK